MLKPCTKGEFERVLARVATLEMFKTRISAAHNYVQTTVRRGRDIVLYAVEAGGVDTYVMDDSLVSPALRAS